MNKEEVISNLCQTVGIVYHTIAKFENPSDCFCKDSRTMPPGYFSHTGETLEYVRKAVVNELIRDGYDPHPHMPTSNEDNKRLLKLGKFLTEGEV